MHHVVYTDAKAKELEKILSGSKGMIVRGAAGRKMPHGRVQPGDRLYFIRNSGEGLVRAAASVTAVINSDALSSEESAQMIQDRQDALQLDAAQVKRWAGKRYLVLIAFDSVEPLEPFEIDRSEYANMDDWLPVGEIDRVRAAAV
jgi:hypothetical protein